MAGTNNFKIKSHAAGQVGTRISSLEAKNKVLIDGVPRDTVMPSLSFEAWQRSISGLGIFGIPLDSCIPQ